MTMPLPRSSSWTLRSSAAASAGLSTRAGARQPEDAVKNAGNSSEPYAATHTPIVSSTCGAKDIHRIHGTALLAVG